MKTKLWILFGLLTLFGSSLATTWAQKMPQDNWYLDRMWGGTGSEEGQFLRPDDVAIGPDGRVYVADSGNNRIQVFEQDGSFVREWPAETRGVLAVGPDGCVYTSASTAISVYTSEGTFLREWGGSGSGPGQFNNIWGLAVSLGNDVLVAEYGNSRIQIFEGDGTFLRQWGGLGTAPGQFSSPRDVAIGPDGRVYVADNGNNRIQVFEQDGSFVREWPASVCNSVAVGADGIVWRGSWSDVQAYTPEGVLIRRIDFKSNSFVYGLAISKDGTLFSVENNLDRIRVFRRSYRTVPGVPLNQLPQPRVAAVAQRPGTTILDIDYRVTDTDTATTENYALAFADGVKNLANLIPVATLTDGTSGNVGIGVASNTDHRISWNAAADWSTDFGELKIEVLVNDGRDTLGFHFITIPPGGGDPELEISQTPYGDSDFLDLWFWRLAKGDPSIALVAGEVIGVGGTYDGQVLASSASTTDAGRAFLFASLNVREATIAEVDRAKLGGTASTVQQWAPRISVGPGEYPKSVNEYGFDTTATGFWAVPLP